MFWVHCSNAARFHQAFRAIANLLALPGRDDPKIDTSQLVTTWLAAEGNRWVLIMDNADDEELFAAPGANIDSQETNAKSTSCSLSAYLPHTLRGKIVITSRSKSAAFRLTKRADSILQVDPMGLEDTRTLLRRKLPDCEHSDEDLAHLVEALQRLPLAVSQAAAYIYVNSPSMTVLRYLDLFKQDEAFQIRLLGEDLGDSRRDEEVPSSVIRTWSISFDQIKRQDNRAADLLSLMAVLDRQGIPRFVLRDRYNNDLDFESAMGKLNSFCLIKT